MSEVSVRPITEENWRQALKLRVMPEQEPFVPSVAVSIAKAYIKPGGLNHDPYGIYMGDTIVGFYSFMYNPYNPKVSYVSGFLIDGAYQGKGIGSAAMAQYLATVRQKLPNCEGVYLTVHPNNEVAERFYANFGFRKTGLVIDGEDAMGLTLSPES